MPIRARLAVLAAAITLALCAIGGVLFVRSFRDGQVESVDRGLRVQADALGRRLTGPDLTVDLEQRGPGGVVATGDVVAQVLDESGRVLSATREAGKRRLVDDAVVRRARSGTVAFDVQLGGEREPFRAVVRPHRSGGVLRLVLVGSSLEPTDAATARVERAVVIGGIIAVLVAGAGGWLVATYALRPVERMRKQAAEISERDPTISLPVPGTHDEIAALGVTMNELLARLHAAIRQQRDFVADAGHELRTPLSVLRTELELARREGRSQAELLDAVEHASVEVERLARLADELLFLARDDGSHTVARRESVPVRPFLDRVASGWDSAADDRGVRIAVDADPSLAAELDPDLLRRALDNLVSNGLRYAPRGSTVDVRAVRTNGSIDLVVADAGPGFPPDFLPHAFERFRRADEARSRDDGGAGLGLAIVAAVARAHGGEATAVNGTGGGAVVTLRLPEKM